MRDEAAVQRREQRLALRAIFEMLCRHPMDVNLSRRNFVHLLRDKPVTVGRRRGKQR